MVVFTKIVIVAGFLVGLSYVGYVNEVMKTAIDPLNRVVLLVFFLMGLYFLMSQIVHLPLFVVRVQRAWRR